MDVIWMYTVLLMSIFSALFEDAAATKSPAQSSVNFFDEDMSHASHHHHKRDGGSSSALHEDTSLILNHETFKNYLPPATGGEDFDMWARAMRLDDMPLDAAVEDHQVSLPQNNTEILAQVGGTATLSCFTGHMSDEVVTWLKKEDDQLLTVGQLVHLSGKEKERLKVSQSHRTKAWELFIRGVNVTDSGQYECQITTHPPVSYFFTLKVTQAVATITGSSEVHIEEGSQLALDCLVLHAPVPPMFIFWYHNGTMINYNQNLMVRTENFTSSLVVSKVTGRDAGVYTCEPHLATKANVTVHVVTGERPAAMQHGRSSGVSTPSTLPASSANLHHLALLVSVLSFLTFTHSYIFHDTTIGGDIEPLTTPDIPTPTETSNTTNSSNSSTSAISSSSACVPLIEGCEDNHSAGFTGSYIINQDTLIRWNQLYSQNRDCQLGRQVTRFDVDVKTSAIEVRSS